MRGMKVGKQKNQAMDGMGVFEMAGKKTQNDPEFGQKLAESTLSDDSLGISSE